VSDDAPPPAAGTPARRAPGTRVPLVIAIGCAALAVLFHARLAAWFAGDDGAPGASSPSRAVVVAAGELRIATSLEPDPPRLVGQRVHVALADAAGHPIDGAHVTVSYDMAAMPNMAEMKSDFAAAPAGDGAYDAVFDLPMAGSWTITVRARTAAAAGAAHYTLTIGTAGLTALGGAAEDAHGAEPGEVQIDPARQAAIGMRTAPAVVAPMALDVRAVGKLTYDETRLHDVVLRLGGYISDLRVDETGQTVAKGQPLFQIYSPELYAAEQDFLLARGSRDAMGSAARGDELVRAAETKLALLGMTDDQIHALAAKGQPLEKITITAPASGYVIEKDVVDGAAVHAGDRVFRIAALDRIWVEADVFEADLARLAPGQAATVTLSYLPGRTYDGKVTFIYPYLDPATRTARVRVELPNAARDLKPDMFATVTFHLGMGDRLQIPVAAVLYDGPRRVVLVDRGGGRIAPRDVTLGAQSGDRVEVVAGLAAGDRVVTSGNFLVAAESRIHAPGAFWQGSGDAGSGGAP
jgi:Cu(I)/Ag(I) efflux system membrane fusion protein